MRLVLNSTFFFLRWLHIPIKIRDIYGSPLSQVIAVIAGHAGFRNGSAENNII